MRIKLRCVFLFIWVYRKYMFCVQIYGKKARRGRYNIHFEALKGSLLKNPPYFFMILRKMSRYFPRTQLSRFP